MSIGMLSVNDYIVSTKNIIMIIAIAAAAKMMETKGKKTYTLMYVIQTFLIMFASL